MRLLAALALAAAPCAAAAQASLDDHFGLELAPAAPADHSRWLARETGLPPTGFSIIASPPRFGRAAFDGEAYGAMLAPAWRGAVRPEAGRYDLRLSPALGGQAEAVAVLRLGRGEGELVRRPDGLGLAPGERFGDRGRWYLFAAASGRAVGLNMLLGASGWDPAGWSSDPSGVMIGDAQVGAGWRKGGAQTSLGLIRREMKGRHMAGGQRSRDDSVVALTFSLRSGD